MTASELKSAFCDGKCESCNSRFMNHCYREMTYEQILKKIDEVIEMSCSNCVNVNLNASQYPCSECRWNYDEDDPRFDENKDYSEESTAVNHPKHYNREGGMECIDEMELVFGIEATINFCLLNVWKYRHRAGCKGDAVEDLKKSDWYMRKYVELREKMKCERKF